MPLVPMLLVRHRILPCFASTAMFVCLSAAGVAQSASSNDSRVDQLYAAARAAQARGDISAAISSYEELVRVAPHLAAAYNNLGMLYLNAHQYPQAAAALKKGLAIDAHMPSASALLGIALFESADYAGSRAALEAALRSNPADENAQLFLAKDLINLKEMDAAAKLLRILAERQPRNQEVWYLLGETYMQLSQQALEKMNAIDPESPLVHEVSGEMMEDMKNYQGALVEYQKAVEMAPAQAGTHYRLGNIEWKLSQWDSALEQFQAELKNDPYNCHSWAQMGNILIMQKSEPQNGLDDVDKALKLCSDLTEAHVDRGNALVKLGRNQEALADLRLAAREDPADPIPHFLMARADRALGDTAGARAEMQTYATLQSQATEAVAARAAAVEKANQNPQ